MKISMRCATTSPAASSSSPSSITAGSIFSQVASTPAAERRPKRTMKTAPMIRRPMIDTELVTSCVAGSTTSRTVLARIQPMPAPSAMATTNTA